MKSVYGKYFTKVACVWAGCFVVFLIIYMLTMAPQKNCITQLQKQLAEKKQMYNSALQASQKETRIQLDEEIQQLRNKLNTFVIDFENSANLTFDISQIASGKAISSFSIEMKKEKEKREGGKNQPKSNKYVSENYIDIDFYTKDFNQFAALLSALERHKPIIFIDRFSIIRSDNDNSEHQVKMNLAVFVKKIQGS